MALEDHICEECSHWDDINGCWLDQPNGGALSPSQNMACPEFDGDDTDWDDDDDWQYDDRDDDPDDDGVQFRGYIDFGVREQDYRGALKMKGEA